MIHWIFFYNYYVQNFKFYLSIFNKALASLKNYLSLQSSSAVPQSNDFFATLHAPTVSLKTPSKKVEKANASPNRTG